MADTRRNMYDPEVVRDLFDEMSRTYGLVNVISSFGFCMLWRRQCIQGASISPRSTVCDLMSGMGELWPGVAARLGGSGEVIAVDLSPVMCDRSRGTAGRLPVSVDVLVEDALSSSIPDGAADVVLSSFGLKTFNDEQMRKLAAQIARILKPGGTFSLLEISVPGLRLLRGPYMFYIRRVIPMLGRLFLGNPDNYRCLGVYTSAFGDCRRFERHCLDAGLRSRYRSFFFGCATGVVGEKPAAQSVA